jgi:hypothetical protein
METLAALRTTEALVRGGISDDRRAAGFAGVLHTLRQVRESVAAPYDALAKGLGVCQLGYSDTQVVTVAELLAGGKTVSDDVIGEEQVDAQHLGTDPAVTASKVPLR